MSGGRKREWIRRKVVAAAAGSGSPRWPRRVRAVSTAVLHRRRLGLGLGLGLGVRVYENVVFYVLWVVESVVVLAKLCFFFLRFGFRL
ncbi:hypothetical protein OsI_23726 [Oryza sativa Indica Group]|uniref:Uncharacterized protein n=1 Tax=Oryza sativa subsp. indica TaxID=39946 RepID=A2YF39_ORYSI|nr:hypothetical protein OsI_23726 [Oryza sativa Indica Group]